ncbi:MAG: hypothetical protein ABSF75_08615 [Terracidiphilus sp.]
MADESTWGTPAGNAVEMGRSSDAVCCPACRSDWMYRAERRGILQKSVFPYFGLYPWHCKGCGAEVMLRKRYRRRRKHNTD